jgi:hypothetical protein
MRGAVTNDVEDTARRGGAGGTNLSCGHHTWNSAWQQAQGRNPQEGHYAPNRIVS